MKFRKLSENWKFMGYFNRKKKRDFKIIYKRGFELKMMKQQVTRDPKGWLCV